MMPRHTSDDGVIERRSLDENEVPCEETWDYWDTPELMIRVSQGEMIVTLHGQRYGNVVNAADRFVTMDLNPLTFAHEFYECYAAIEARNLDMTPAQITDLALKRWWYDWHIAKIKEVENQ